MTTVPLTWRTSTKSPTSRPSSSQISFGMTTWRRWPSLLMGITAPLRSIVRMLLFILSDYQMAADCQRWRLTVTSRILCRDLREQLTDCACGGEDCASPIVQRGCLADIALHGCGSFFGVVERNPVGELE